MITWLRTTRELVGRIGYMVALWEYQSEDERFLISPVSRGEYTLIDRAHRDLSLKCLITGHAPFVCHRGAGSLTQAKCWAEKILEGEI